MKRSMLRLSAGEPRWRASGSPSRPRGSRGSDPRLDRVELGIAGVAGRQAQAVAASAPGCRAGTGRSRASAGSLISRRGPKPMPPAILSGSDGRALRADRDRWPADGDAVAELEVEPGEQRRIGDGAERAVALRQQVGERLRRIGDEPRRRADRRASTALISTRAASPSRRRAMARRVATPSRRAARGVEERASPRRSPRGGSGRRRDRRRGSTPALAGEPVGEARATPSRRRRSPCTPSAMQARKTPKPRKAAAQVAQREAQRRAASRERRRAGRRRTAAAVHRLARLTASSIRPERRRTVRSQRRGEAGIVGDQHQGRAALALRRRTAGRRSRRRWPRRDCRSARRRPGSPGRARARGRARRAAARRRRAAAG